MKTTNVSPVITMTALETLRGALSNDKGLRHVLIVSEVAKVVALAVCQQPPKGVGNPADHAKLVALFTDAKLTKYAEHSAGVKAAIKGQGQRSISSWDEALEFGTSTAMAAYDACAPLVVSKDAQAARDAKKAEGKAARELKAKEEEKAASDLRAAEVSDAYAKGVRAGLSAQAVADAIRANQFSAADLKVIRAALADEGRTVEAATVLLTA